jgi:hypothetical protein
LQQRQLGGTQIRSSRAWRVEEVLQGAEKLDPTRPWGKHTQQYPDSARLCCVLWHPGLWIARREELGHPLGTINPSSLSTSSDDEAAAAAAKGAGQAVSSPQLFVLEVGSEELPPDDVLSGMEQLR